MVARVQVGKLGKKPVLGGEVQLPPETCEVHAARRGRVEVNVEKRSVLLRRDFGKREGGSQLGDGEQGFELVEALAAVLDVHVLLGTPLGTPPRGRRGVGCVGSVSS